MIDKFSEIKKILKLRNACSGILRVKVAGLLEKQALQYTDYMDEERDIREQMRHNNFNETRYRALTSDDILALRQQIDEHPGDASLKDALRDAVNKIFPDITTYDDAIAAIDASKKSYNDNSSLIQKLRQVQGKINSYFNRGGGGGGNRGSGNLIKIKMSDGSIVDWDRADGPIPADATLINPGTSPTADIEELASSGLAYMYNPPNGEHYLCVAGQAPLKINDEALAMRLMAKTVKASPKEVRQEASKDGKSYTVYYSNGTQQRFDAKTKKPISDVTFVPPSSLGGPTTDPATSGITPENKASFNDYLADQGWRQNSSGGWEQYASPRSTKRLNEMTQQQYRDNLLRYNSANSGEFNIRGARDYESDELVDASKFKDIRRDYRGDTNALRDALRQANSANDTGAWYSYIAGDRRRAINELANPENWNADGSFNGDISQLANAAIIRHSTRGTMSSRISPSDLQNYYGGLSARTLTDNVSDLALGGVGAAAGWYLGDRLNNNDMGYASKAVHGLSKLLGFTKDDYNKDSTFNKWVDRLTGAALLGGAGLLGSSYLNNRANRRRAIRNLRGMNALNHRENLGVANEAYNNISTIDSSGKKKSIVNPS